MRSRERRALHDEILAAGAVAIFGPGTVIPEAAEELLDALERDRPEA